MEDIAVFNIPLISDSCSWRRPACWILFTGWKYQRATSLYTHVYESLSLSCFGVHWARRHSESSSPSLSAGQQTLLKRLFSWKTFEVTTATVAALFPLTFEAICKSFEPKLKLFSKWRYPAYGTHTLTLHSRAISHTIVAINTSTSQPSDELSWDECSTIWSWWMTKDEIMFRDRSSLSMNRHQQTAPDDYGSTGNWVWNCNNYLRNMFRCKSIFRGRWQS